MVTKQQQLEYAAKYIEKWKSGYDYAVIEETIDGHLYVRWPSICTSGIAKKEWQQERDKMQKRDAINDMTPVAIPLSVGKHVDAQDLQKVIIQNNSSATITATKAGGSEMTITAQDNSRHERRVRPSVGEPSELWFGGSFAYNCEFICMRGYNYIVWNLDADRPDCADIMNSEFRPLRTEREKAIDAACEAVGGVIGGRLIIERLYDAGLLKEKNK